MAQLGGLGKVQETFLVWRINDRLEQFDERGGILFGRKQDPVLPLMPGVGPD